MPKRKSTNLTDTDVDRLQTENAVLRKRLKDAGIPENEVNEGAAAAAEAVIESPERKRRDAAANSPTDSKTSTDATAKADKNEKPARKKYTKRTPKPDVAPNGDAPKIKKRVPSDKEASTIYRGVYEGFLNPNCRQFFARYYPSTTSKDEKKDQITLGPFKTEEAAAVAYDDAVRPLGRPVNIPRLPGDKKCSRSVKGSLGPRKGMPWCAVILSGGKTVVLGYFLTEEEAARVYDAKARELGKPVNFPEEGEVQATRQGSSQYLGVVWHKPSKLWSAMITVKDKNRTLGYFKSEEDAARRFDEVAGPLGRHLNFPNEGAADPLVRSPRFVPLSKYVGVRQVKGNKHLHVQHQGGSSSAAALLPRKPPRPPPPPAAKPSPAAVPNDEASASSAASNAASSAASNAASGSASASNSTSSSTSSAAPNAASGAALSSTPSASALTLNLPSDKAVGCVSI